MIFVILGTNPFQFDRLCKIADEYAIKTEEEVFIQAGYTKYSPKYCSFEKFLSRENYIDKIKKSEILITHAGIRVTLDAIKYKKKLIVVPRLAKFNEHTDNHQCELARVLVEQRRVLALNENMGVEEIISVIERSKKDYFTQQEPTSNILAYKLTEYIKNLEAK